MSGERVARAVSVPAGEVRLAGLLSVPAGAAGVVVLLAHGSGAQPEARGGPVADALRQGGFATLLMNLLDEAEAQADARTAHLRFDIELLARRVLAATEWL